MTNLNDIKALKTNQLNTLATEVSKHVEALKRSTEWAKLIKQVEAFEDNDYDENYSHSFECDGALIASIELDIPKEWHGGDSDVLRAISESIFMGSNLVFTPSVNTSSMHVESFLGEATTINEYASRNEYYVHSRELGLKVMKLDVTSFEHALYLIEVAMRKHGVFESIVKLDSYGGFGEFTDTGLGRLSDDELKTHGEQFK